MGRKGIGEEIEGIVDREGLALEEETAQWLEKNFVVDSEKLSSWAEKLAKQSQSTKLAILKRLAEKGKEKAFPLFTKMAEKELDEEVIQAIGSVPKEESARLLVQFLEKTYDKRLQKLIKKIIYRLKTQGVDIPQLPSLGEPIFKRISPLPLQAFVSPIDSEGGRVALLAKPFNSRMLNFFSLLIEDTKGITEIYNVKIPREVFQDSLKQHKEDGIVLVDIDPSYLQYLVLEARQKNLATKTSLPPGFLILEKMWPSKTEITEAFVYNILDVKLDLRDLEGSSRLHEIEGFLYWSLGAEEIAPYIPKLDEIEESPLIVAPFRKEARQREIIKEAAQNLFGKERRQIYKRRLEEMAYVLYKTRGENEARLALVAALALEEDGVRAEEHPFLLEMIKKSIDFAKMGKEKEEKRSLIIRLG